MNGDPRTNHAKDNCRGSETGTGGEEERAMVRCGEGETICMMFVVRVTAQTVLLEVVGMIFHGGPSWPNA